jgi:hypothetical protein
MYWDGKNVLKEHSGNDDVSNVNDTLVGDSGNE